MKKKLYNFIINLKKNELQGNRHHFLIFKIGVDLVTFRMVSKRFI